MTNVKPPDLARPSDHGRPQALRRRLQFRLRTLFLLVGAVAVGLAWPTQAALRQRRAVAFVQSLGGTVEYRTSPGPVVSYLREWLGRDYVDDVSAIYLAGAELTDRDLPRLAPLANVETLSLVTTRLTNASVPELARFRRLALLDVRFTQLDAAGFAALKKDLPQAKVLCWNDVE